MAETWVALLRGVNVGGANRVPMAELRALLGELGCGGPRTYIASGNALFTHDARDRGRLAAELEAAIEGRFGIAPRVVLRTAGELATLVDGHPFVDTEHTHVVFLAGEPAATPQLDVAPDEVVVAGRDVYVRYPNGYSQARATAAVLERALGVPGTARNWRTVAKLHALASGT